MFTPVIFPCTYLYAVPVLHVIVYPVAMGCNTDDDF